MKPPPEPGAPATAGNRKIRRPAPRPNILIFLTDQHSKHLLGCYGNSLVRTPHMDRLAAEGLRFTSAYCPAPLCVPSRMSFLTSRTPSANRVWNNHHQLASGLTTWAHALTLSGYETALLGRMHFEGPDQHHGFEHRPVGEPCAGAVGAPWKGSPAWQRYPSSTSGQSRPAVEIAGRGNTYYQWADEEITRRADAWLREKASSAKRRPFAAVVGYLLPHCPFIAPGELFDAYHDRVRIPPVTAAQPATIQRFRKLRGLSDPELPADRARNALAAYYGLCEHVDRLIGNLLTTLDDTGLTGDTLVLYTSDHGEMAGEHGCWWKSTYYEGSAGVPLVARWPGVIRPNTESPALCNLMDIGPTLAEIAGNENPLPNDGQSLYRILTEGQDPTRRDETFCEFVDPRGGQLLPSRMIRTGPWKLWHYADQEQLPPALFNLRDDPDEDHDLANDPRFAAVRERLLVRLYEDWNPEDILSLCKDYQAQHTVLKRWGKRIRPDAPHALPLPPGIEDSVELL